MNETATEKNHDVTPLALKERLACVPVNGFAAIMGLSGLSIAWQNIAPASGFSVFIGYLLASATTLLFAILLVSYFRKYQTHPEKVKQEFQHTLLLNFFPAISMSILLMAIIWHTALPRIATLLWLTGAVLQLTLTLHVLNRWLFKEGVSLTDINPTWFIPVVGNIVAPIGGAYLGFQESSWFFFSIGIFFWVVLSTLIFLRLFFREPGLPAPMLPTLFIFLAPPSLTLVSYAGLVGTLDAAAHFFYYIALFTALLLLTNYHRFVQAPFSLASWAYSFPSAAFTVATIKVAAVSGNAVFWWFSCLLLILLTALMAWLVIKTAKAFINNKICVPE
ncbi:MAG: C4-dicarboxylate ABC transporter [Gammaproteobacteria bacterium]|nr:MAG: C4-dicarboxylate ABC transporter [Pseudomonadota bacterium]PIE38817.1 MAG: C4-dicarboxylate ABC transporter [Gammaproteobacteria bacterium]